MEHRYLRGFAPIGIDCKLAVEMWTFSAAGSIVERPVDGKGGKGAWLSSPRSAGGGRTSMAGNDAGLRPQRDMVNVLTLTCYEGPAEAKRDGRGGHLPVKDCAGNPRSDIRMRYVIKALAGIAWQEWMDIQLPRINLPGTVFL